MYPSIRIPPSEFTARIQALTAYLQLEMLSGAVLYDAAYILYAVSEYRYNGFLTEKNGVGFGLEYKIEF